MAKPPKAYVLDRLLSLMNIISQANIYIIVCGIHTISSIYAIYRESLYFKLFPIPNCRNLAS